MRRLILFRHAKTEPRPPGVEDIDRALVERGWVEAAMMAKVLAQADLAPDLVLVSPALRARQTWERARDRFEAARVEVRDALYNATAEEALEEIGRDTAGADTVLVVGHNPSLQELAVNLLVDGAGSAGDIERLSAGFPTGTLAAFVFNTAGRASLEALFHPRDHREDPG